MSTVQGTAAFRNRFQAIDRLTLRSLVRRAALLWLLTRIALQLIIAFASLAVDASIASVPTAGSLRVCAAVALLMAVDVRATREHILLANLGVGQRHVVAIGAATAFALECALLIVLALLAPG